MLYGSEKPPATNSIFSSNWMKGIENFSSFSWVVSLRRSTWNLEKNARPSIVTNPDQDFAEPW